MTKFAGFFLLLLLFAMSGCTTIQRTVHMYGSDAPAALEFQYRDGGSSSYYTFTVGADRDPDTVVFFYGGSGCASWKSVMPNYVDGMAMNARVFALNKRKVDDRSAGIFCSAGFEASDNPAQWFSDYAEFIAAQLKAAPRQPRNVVLVGVSEGGLIASKVAGELPSVTHLAIIGHGGYTLRKSIQTLVADGRVSKAWLNPDQIWKDVQSDPTSLDKKTTGHSYKYWSDIMDFDPLPNYLRLKIPVLVGIGERDKSIPVESACFLESKFKQDGKSNLRLLVYPGADHRLNADGRSYRAAFFSELSRLLPATRGAADNRTAASGMLSDPVAPPACQPGSKGLPVAYVSDRHIRAIS